MILRKIIIYLFFIVVFTFGYKVVTARAASLYFSPSSKNVSVGNIVEIGVYVNTGDQAINNVEGGVVYPTDLLEVISTSKSGSIFSLWVEEPSFSNSSGRVSFNGGVPTPGYKGSAGRIINIVFRAKSKGEATLYFSSSAVRANDGLGTNILNGSGSANIGINVSVSEPPKNTGNNNPPSAVAPEPEPVVLGGLPPAPQISSETHPNQDSWYNNNKALFNWKLASGITATQLLVGLKQNVVPTVTYVPAISSRQLEVLEDGVWYFHVRLKNSKGWSGVTNFRFQIDTKNPDYFSMKVVDTADKTVPTRALDFEASDATSGISHYEIQIDDGDPLRWIDDGSHRYTTKALGPGRHVLIARAVDKAGNFLSSFNEFFIDSLQAPQISDYPQELQAGSILVARGKSYPNAKVLVWLQRESDDVKSVSVDTDQSGNFTFISDKKLSDGLYKLWAEALDQRGAKSAPSEKLTVMARPLTIVRAGSWVITVLSVLIPLIALIILLIFMWFFSKRKWHDLRGRLNKEVVEAETSLHQEFNKLRKSIGVHLNALERVSKSRKLTKEEKALLRQLGRDLATAERSVEAEIEDIREEVNKK